MAYRGKFVPKHPKKYQGDPSNIVYRSLWERDCMRYFDGNPNVIYWASEEVVVPYLSPIDNRWHRYFPDFLIRVQKPDGSTDTVMIEVKPAKETREPKVKSRITKNYLYEVKTWGVNQAKWKYAEEFCADRKWKFVVWTEKDIYGKEYK